MATACPGGEKPKGQIFDMGIAAAVRPVLVLKLPSLTCRLHFGYHFLFTGTRLL